ncbi:MAG: hypothetical protein ABW020_08670, partial [Candidatus Rokuibacteriota bacterium]
MSFLSATGLSTTLFLALLLFALLGVPGPAGAGSVAAILSSDADEYKEALKGFKESAGHQVVA